MKTRIYATPAVKGLKGTVVVLSRERVKADNVLIAMNNAMLFQSILFKICHMVHNCHNDAHMVDQLQL